MISLEVFRALERLVEAPPWYSDREVRSSRSPVSALQGSPFETYFVPGPILFLVLGLGPLAAAVLAWRGHRLAPAAALVVGVALLIWMAVEISIVGYSGSPPLQPFNLLLGAVITGVGWSWRSGDK